MDNEQWTDAIRTQAPDTTTTVKQRQKSEWVLDTVVDPWKGLSLTGAPLLHSSHTHIRPATKKIGSFLCVAIATPHEIATPHVITKPNAIANRPPPPDQPYKAVSVLSRYVYATLIHGGADQHPARIKTQNTPPIVWAIDSPIVPQIVPPIVPPFVLPSVPQILPQIVPQTVARIVYLPATSHPLSLIHI